VHVVEVVQRPSEQVWPVVQALPQRPQLARSVIVLTQAGGVPHEV